METKTSQKACRDECDRRFLSKVNDIVNEFSDNFTSEYVRKITDEYIEKKYVLGDVSEDGFVRASFKVPGAPRLKASEKELMLKAVFRWLNKVKINQDLYLRDPLIVDFERRLRKFLISKLSVLGKDWESKAIPPSIVRKLKKIRTKQVTAGYSPKKLIEYASFGGVYSIIEYGPCWDILDSCFGDKTWLREQLVDELDVYVRASLYHSHEVPKDYHVRRDLAIKNITEKMEGCT